MWTLSYGVHNVTFTPLLNNDVRPRPVRDVRMSKRYLVGTNSTEFNLLGFNEIKLELAIRCGINDGETLRKHMIGRLCTLTIPDDSLDSAYYYLSNVQLGIEWGDSPFMRGTITLERTGW